MATRLSRSVTCTVDITQLGRMFEANCIQNVQAVANEALTELVMRTPIDVGTAKSNWVVGINRLGQGPIQAHDPGTHGSTFNENAQQAISEGRAEISGATRITDVVNITNNLEYIRKLNEGSSTQSPAGFVEDAVVNAVHSVVGQISGARIVP